MFQDVKVEDFDDLDDISNADISCKYLAIWLIHIILIYYYRNQ